MHHFVTLDVVCNVYITCHNTNIILHIKNTTTQSCVVSQKTEVLQNVKQYQITLPGCCQCNKIQARQSNFH
jgi:hypothetical protein